MTKEQEIFLVCDCYSHALSVEFDKEFGELNLSIWNRGFNANKLTWPQRLRFIWKIVSTGTLWHDYICLDKQKAHQLAKYIQDNVQKG